MLDKLDLLSLYFKQYRRVAGGGTYIDGFAGDGRVVVNGVTRPGSAAIALHAGAFRRLLYFERPAVAKRCKRLNNEPERLVKLTSVYPGISTTKWTTCSLAGAIPRDKPCFAFLDPNSTQLKWSTVQTLARYKGKGGRSED